MRCLKCLKCLNIVHLIFKKIPYFTHEKHPKNLVSTAPKVKTVKAPLQSSYKEVLQRWHDKEVVVWSMMTLTNLPLNL